MPFGPAQDPVLHGRVGALVLHSTHDPKETTSRARETFRSSFERQVDPDGVLDPAERQRRAEFARRAHYARMALASSIKRSKGKKTTAEHALSTAASDITEVAGADGEPSD